MLTSQQRSIILRVDLLRCLYTSFNRAWKAATGPPAPFQALFSQIPSPPSFPSLAAQNGQHTILCFISSTRIVSITRSLATASAVESGYFPTLETLLDTGKYVKTPLR